MVTETLFKFPCQPQCKEKFITAQPMVVSKIDLKKIKVRESKEKLLCTKNMNIYAYLTWSVGYRQPIFLLKFKKTYENLKKVKKARKVFPNAHEIRGQNMKTNLSQNFMHIFTPWREFFLITYFWCRWSQVSFSHLVRKIYFKTMRL